MKTNKKKKVLIALDYDPTAQKVAEAGFAMAKAMEAEVILLHVMVDPTLYTTTYANMGVWQLDRPYTLETFEHLKTNSRYFLEKAKLHLADPSIEIVQKEGDFARSILETAKELSVDIIVMGSHSQKWLENILMGSVTEEVLRKTTIPMYIVPTKKKEVW
jgi:nucleotide-binding universal stress UspA family protein